MVNSLDKALALDAVSIAKGQSVGRIPIDTVSSVDYVQRAIADARAKGATYPELQRATRRGLAGRPNPSLN